jgi:hypothetical protein
MTNTRRNTIVLSALLLLLSGFSFVVYRNLNKKAVELTTQNEKTSKKIAVLERQISNIDSLKYEYEIRKAMVAEQSKVIVAADNPTITYRYLLKMLSWMKRNIIFDFAMSDKGKKDASWNEYVLSGRGNYHDVVELTKNLENQRAVITIEDLAIGSDGLVNSDSVSFSIVMRTHFNDSGIDAENLLPKKMPATKSFFQLFRTKVNETTTAEPDVDPRLVRIDQSTLIGIADNRIFLRDSQGVIKILSIKDKIAYGYLYSIDEKQGKATFMINKYGIPEEQSLFITNAK